MYKFNNNRTMAVYVSIMKTGYNRFRLLDESVVVTATTVTNIQNVKEWQKDP